MGQIVTNKVHSDRCNISVIQGGSKANFILAKDEIWLVDSTNSQKGDNGYGKYDSYIIGDGVSPAESLVVYKIDNVPDDEDINNFVTVKYKTPSGQLVIDGEVGDLWIYDDIYLKKCIMAGGTASAQYETITPNPNKIYKYNTTFFCYYNNAFVQVGERGPQGLDGYEIFDSLDDLTGKTAEQKALMIPNATLIEAILALIPNE